MRTAIFLFDGVTALDAIGPYEALSRLPEIDICFCATKPGEVSTADGFLGLTATRSIFDLESPEIIIFPGGVGRMLSPLLKNQQLQECIRKLSESSTYTASVCTGAFFLAAAGLLAGQTVATHWRAKGMLANFGASYSGERVSQTGKILTSAGVSAGVELGLRLCGLIAGESVGRAVELSMEYCPSPPFGGAGHTAASDETIGLITSRLRQ